MMFSAFFVQMLLRGWLVNELTDSPFMVSLIPVLFMAPMLVFTLIGGELADRFKRTRVIVLGESVVAVTYIALAVLVLTDVVVAWHVLALTGVHGVAASLVAPSRQSLIGNLVRERLQRPAIGLAPAMFNMAQILGPLVGGIVLELWGTGPASVMSVVLILPALPIMARLKPVGKSPLAQTGSVIENIRDGAKYISGHPMLRWYLIAGFVLVITVNTWGALFPPLAKDVLGRGAGGLATLQVAIGIGALIGAVMSISMGQRFGEKRLMVFSGLLFAALVIGLAASEIFWLSVVIVGFAACVATVYFVTNMIAMQLTASPEFRSRVISVRFIMFGFGPFGMIALGIIAEYYGTQLALTIVAATGAALLLGVTALLRTGPGKATDVTKTNSDALKIVPPSTVASAPEPSSSEPVEEKASAS